MIKYCIFSISVLFLMAGCSKNDDIEPLFSSVDTLSQSENWHVGTGLPAGKVVSDLYYFDNTFYASLYDQGIYRSTDNGSTWQKFGKGLPSTYYSGIAISATVSILATMDGVYRSEDKGENWSKTDNPMKSNDTALEIYFDESRIFTCSQNAGSLKKPLYISTDQGITWQSASEGLPTSGLAQSIKRKGENLFLISDNKIFKSTNGTSWENVSNNISASLLYDLEVDDQYIYAVGNTINRSEDGIAWEKLSNGIDKMVQARTITKAKGNLIISGKYVYASADQGNSWYEITGDLINTNFVQASAANESYLLLGLTSHPSAATVWQRKL